MTTTRLLNGFEDATFGKKEWNNLLMRGESNWIAQTWEWQKTWWDHFGKGKLLLILAEKKGVPFLLAPLCVEDGMVFNLCPKETLDWIGFQSDEECVEAVLKKAMEVTNGFIGLRFYFLPEGSSTVKTLQIVSERLGLKIYREKNIPSPFINIAADPERAYKITRKKSLRSHENYYLREGKLEVFHLKNRSEILPHMDDFFEQHIKRRKLLNESSFFEEELNRSYFTELMSTSSANGWMRFTRVNWNDEAIAFAYGFSYRSRYLYLITSFNIDYAKHSPGEVLLKHYLSDAVEEQCASFDFGLGDEPYKYRFANQTRMMHSWGLYKAT